MKIGKEKDLVELQEKYLKWGMNILAPHIMEIFNNVIQQGFPRDWTNRLAIPLFKSGDINNPSNYRTIMINPLFAKLFSGMVENIINKWEKVKEKREKGQMGFKPKHSTIDHGITLRHIVEKVWGAEKYFSALLTSKRHLTQSLQISCGVEWKKLNFFCITEPLSIEFMKR